MRVPETLDLDALLSASEAALYTSLSVQAVGNWHSRGYINPATGKREWLAVATDERGAEIRDAQGRPKYRLRDVARADAATHARRRHAA